MTTEARALRDLAGDGLESLGSVTLGGVVVAGDPAFLGNTPANGAYWAAGCAAARWHLLGCFEGDVLTELVACQADALGFFYDTYDMAGLVAEIAAGSGRIALLDARRKDDVELRRAMFEPEELPWVRA